MIDKAQEAFVSFVRYYKEHQLTFIFSSLLLDIGQCANSFALFKIPRVKEILGQQISSFTQVEIDPEAVPYADANKGRQRADLQGKRKEKLERKKEQQ